MWIFYKTKANPSVSFSWLCYEWLCYLFSGVPGKVLVTLYDLKNHHWNYIDPFKGSKKCKFHARTKPTWVSVFYDFIMSECDMLIGVSGKDLATLYGLKQPPLEWSWPLSKWHFWQTSLFLWPFLATQSLTKQHFYSTRMKSVNKNRDVVLRG